jgi:hypothetical protein
VQFAQDVTSTSNKSHLIVMPPKSSAGKEKDLGGDEEVLQAVILADSFNKRFKPLTSGKPRVSDIRWHTKLDSKIYARH